MSGYMMTARGAQGHRVFFMSNNSDPKAARAELDKSYPTKEGSRILSPLSDATLAHFRIEPHQSWLCFTIKEATGKLVSTSLSDSKSGGRGKLRLLT